MRHSLCVGFSKSIDFREAAERIMRGVYEKQPVYFL